MLERMSKNISFALDNFEHEAARKDGERATRRLARMFGAISATNEAIMRAKTERELYQLVCDAAVHSGKSFATVALLAEPGSTWLKPVAGTGEAIDLITTHEILDRSRQSLWPRRRRPGFPHPEAGDQCRHRRQQRRLDRGAAPNRRRRPAWPCPDQGGQEHRRPDVLCRQVLGNRRGDRRTVLADRRERLVRARQFRPCRREGEGRRADAAPHPHVCGAERDQRSHHARKVARTNCTSSSARRRRRAAGSIRPASCCRGRTATVSRWWRRPGRRRTMRVGCRFRPARPMPEGRGLCGHRLPHAARPPQPTIFANDPRGMAFQQVIQSDGARSGAAFPLLVDGQPVGVMLFISSETGHVHARIRRIAAAARRQRLLCARTISTAPTRRRAPRSRRSGWPACWRR